MEEKPQLIIATKIKYVGINLSKISKTYMEKLEIIPERHKNRLRQIENISYSWKDDSAS